jgi:hypothetical protein
MKIITYRKLLESVQKDFILEADKISSRLEPALVEKYYHGKDSIVGFRLDSTASTEQELNVLLTLTNGSLEGKTILDLGCGCTVPVPIGGEHDGFDRMYEPWLCRYLLELGINHIGVDIGPNIADKFNFHRADLTEPSALDFIPSSSIDIANAHQLFDSPFLLHVIRFGGNLYDILRPQLERIIKPEGYFVYNN